MSDQPEQFRQFTSTEASAAGIGVILGGTAGEVVDGVITVPSSSFETQPTYEPNQVAVFGIPALVVAVLAVAVSNRIRHRRYNRAQRVMNRINSIPALTEEPDQAH